MNGFRKLLALLFVVSLFAGAASAIGIKEVETSSDFVKYGQKFYVTVKLRAPEAKYTAKFYVDDYMFKELNVGIEDELEATFDDTEWEMGELKGISCGPAIARVELYTASTKQQVANETVEFNIGMLPILEFQPSRPSPNQNVKVKLLDPDSKAPLDGVRLEIKELHGTTEPWRAKTASDGTVPFQPKNSGEYSITFEDREVCGSKTFYIKRPMMVDGPHPDDPVVGEMINLAVPASSSVGVKIYDSKGEVYKTTKAAYNGGVNFTIDEPGDYLIMMGEISPRYWSTNRSITVSGRQTPKIEVAPELPVLFKPVTITVTARGEPLDDATIVITKPDGVENQYRSTTFGSITYEGVTIPGKYGIKATKERYDTGVGDFEAKNAFSIKVTPETPTVKDLITILVLDQNNKPVPDALVEIPQAGIKKATDLAGKLALNLQESKKYDIKVTKDLFWDKSSEVTTLGMLSIGECQNEIRLGEEITISALDQFDQPIEAEINVKDTLGVIKKYTGTSQTLKPEKPGAYEVSLRKTNYSPANMTFKVLPYLLDVSATMDSGVLYTMVTHEGEPVENLVVGLDWVGGKVNASTNDQGIASFAVNKEGNVTVTANLMGSNNFYIEKNETIEVARSYDLFLLATPLVLIAVITVMTLIVIFLGRKYLGSAIDAVSNEDKGKGSKLKHQSDLMGEKQQRRTRLSDL